MTEQEIKKRIKADMEYHIFEYELSEKVAIEVTADKYLLKYLDGYIEEDEYKALLKALGPTIDELSEEDMNNLRQARKEHLEAKAKESAVEDAKEGK